MFLIDYKFLHPMYLIKGESLVAQDLERMKHKLELVSGMKHKLELVSGLNYLRGNYY